MNFIASLDLIVQYSNENYVKKNIEEYTNMLRDKQVSNGSSKLKKFKENCVSIKEMHTT